MSEIRWIKIVTDIFADEKILLIESMPEADTIIVIWFKLLCLAGIQNNLGIVTFKDKIPYTDEMLATIMRRPLNTVRLALETFEQFGMIERSEGIILIPNWEKHQNLDGMDKIREQNRIRKQNQRERQKIALLEDMSRDMSRDVTQQNKKEEEEKDKEKEERIDYQQIADMYNDTCVSYPHLKSLSDSRKKAIKARLKTYSISDFQTLFDKAEKSDFLKGSNSRNWSATFDWLIKDSNMAKVLDGNYDNKEAIPNGRHRIDWENV